MTPFLFISPPIQREHSARLLRLLDSVPIDRPRVGMIEAPPPDETKTHGSWLHSLVDFARRIRVNPTDLLDRLQRQPASHSGAAGSMTEITSAQ